MLNRLLKRDTAAELPAGTPRILLIDDDEDELTLVREALSRAGATYQVDWAPSYEEGLERLLDGGYEVGLVDYRLGSWSGLDVLREARNRGNHVPLIMLTGERDHSIDQAATGLGAVDFLQKGKSSPVEFERAVRFAAANGRTLEAARQAEVRMAALEDIGHALGADGISAESLDAVVGLISERLGRPYVSLYLAEADHFRLSAQRGHADALSVVERGGHLVNALRMRKPWVVPNQSADPEMRVAADPLMELCVPLLEGEETLGLLFVGYWDDEPIEEGEHAALVSIASRVTDALGLAHDRRDISGRAVRMRRLGAFLAHLGATTSSADLLAQLATAAAGVVDVEWVVVSVASAAEKLKVISSHGPGTPSAGAIVEGDSVARRALAEGKPASMTEPQPTGFDGRKVSVDRWTAALPLNRGGKTLGIIQFSRHSGPFDIYEREAATFLAAQIALLLSNCPPDA